ncbi:MAG: hypothetical protein ABW169_13610 [Sphingobium sp.]
MTHDPLFFTPVPLTRVRARGWSSEVQHGFIAALAQCGLVGQAARSVGRSARGAYRLRARVGAESFAAAWDMAVEMGLGSARDRVMERLAGTRAHARYRNGRKVAERRGDDPVLLYAALRALAGELRRFREANDPFARAMAEAAEEARRNPTPPEAYALK